MKYTLLFLLIINCIFFGFMTGNIKPKELNLSDYEKGKRVGRNALKCYLKQSKQIGMITLDPIRISHIEDSLELNRLF